MTTLLVLPITPKALKTKNINQYMKVYMKGYYQKNKDKIQTKRRQFNYTITIDGIKHVFNSKKDIIKLIIKEKAIKLDS